MSRSRPLVVLLSVLLVAVVALGAAAAWTVRDGGSLWPPRLPRAAEKAGPTPSPRATVPPLPPLPTRRPAPAVLEPLPPLPSSAPRPARLAAAMRPVLRAAALGRRVGASVVDVATGRTLLGAGASTPLVPASTTKLLTATAALEALGPQARFPTSVVRGPGRTVVLVGGGDPTLTRAPAAEGRGPRTADPARIAALAGQLVRRLTADGRRVVRLRYDAGLFRGPATAPSWPKTYVPDGVVSPVSALSLDAGRVAPHSSDRSSDPAAAAAADLATRLKRRGVRVLGAPSPATAAGTATTLAEVTSPPLSDIVERMIDDSDNDIAEALLRQIALADRVPADFASATADVRRRLTDLGLPVRGLRLVDGSGLSRANSIPPQLLTAVLALASSPSHPRLRPIVTGLPVAGVSGTLAARFGARSVERATGRVRAKTGTLSGVSGLAGLVVDASGRLLAFAVLADRISLPQTLDARADLDAAAARLAACGCR